MHCSLGRGVGHRACMQGVWRVIEDSLSSFPAMIAYYRESNTLIYDCYIRIYDPTSLSDQPTSARRHQPYLVLIVHKVEITFLTTDYFMASSSLITQPTAGTNRVGPKTLPVRTMAHQHQAGRGPEVAEQLDEDTKNKYVKGRIYKALLILGHRLTTIRRQEAW